MIISHPDCWTRWEQTGAGYWVSRGEHLLRSLSSDRKEILPASHAIGVFGTLISQQVSGEKIGQSYFFISNSTLFRILVRFFLCALVQRLIPLQVSPWRVLQRSFDTASGVLCTLYSTLFTWIDRRKLCSISNMQSLVPPKTPRIFYGLLDRIYCTQEMKGVTWELYTGSEGESHSHWQCIQEVKESFSS